MHFQIFGKKYYDEVNGCIFYKTYTDEKQIENSNIQLSIKIIRLLVLKENVFKMVISCQIPRFPLTLTLTKNEVLICLCV